MPVYMRRASPPKRTEFCIPFTRVILALDRGPARRMGSFAVVLRLLERICCSGAIVSSPWSRVNPLDCVYMGDF